LENGQGGLELSKKHLCEGELPYDGYGEAIDHCMEYDDNSFWAGNGEYGSAVNYCPFCGAKAPRQVDQAFKDKVKSKREIQDEQRLKKAREEGAERSCCWRISINTAEEEAGVE